MVALCASASAKKNFTAAPVFAQDTGVVGGQPRGLVPPVVKPLCTPCLLTVPLS